MRVYPPMSKKAVAFAIANRLRLGKRDGYYVLYGADGNVIEMSHNRLAHSALIMMRKYLGAVAHGYHPQS